MSGARSGLNKAIRAAATLKEATRDQWQARRLSLMHGPCAGLMDGIYAATQRVGPHSGDYPRQALMLVEWAVLREEMHAHAEPIQCQWEVDTDFLPHQASVDEECETSKKGTSAEATHAEGTQEAKGTRYAGGTQ